MKKIKNKVWSICACAIAFFGLTSCNDFLDRAPLSSVSPDKFFMSESDLATYSVNLYDVFPTPEGWSMESGEDNNTDNQAAVSPDNRFSPGNYRVAKNGGNWDFKNIYKCNYFLDAVLARQKENKIEGIGENINHYIGEVYFLRAYNYFLKLKEYGDFPIIKEAMTADDEQALINASKRMPRNEVARFILSDLDKAIILLKDVSPNKKNRISKNVAYLFKSRVALFEASWLMNFKNTPFVPQGPGWPGGVKEYNASYNFPSGSIDQEIAFFLDQTIESSAVVAKISLTNNTKNDVELTGDIQNPYFRMFSDVDLEKYDEVLLWRDYDATLSSHVTTRYLYYGSNGSGYTKGFVESFLMENGLPIYASTGTYKGDEDFSSFRSGRDWRLRLFCKVKSDLLYNDGSENRFEHPMIISSTDERDVTGYSLRKYCNFVYYPGAFVDTGWPIFRAVEGYLNYMEAYYMRYNRLDAAADGYWKAIRQRAGVDTDYGKTIAATDISKEAKGDWGAYTGGRLLTDATLYNIRRERRCEFIGEGMRYDDLRRWRSFDQMITTPYIVEGFNLWKNNYRDYKDKDGKMTLISEGSTANVSSASQSTYLRPYQIAKDNNRFYDGYKWHAAHYLSPIAMDNFIQTANKENKDDLSTSPIYQNPGWPTIAQQAPGDVPNF